MRCSVRKKYEQTRTRSTHRDGVRAAPKECEHPEQVNGKDRKTAAVVGGFRADHEGWRNEAEGASLVGWAEKLPERRLRAAWGEAVA